MNDSLKFKLEKLLEQERDFLLFKMDKENLNILGYIYQ